MSRTLDLTMPHRPIKFAHIVLRTRRLEAMRDWYAQVLATQANYENEHMAFLSYDDEHHRVALLALPGLTEADTEGNHVGVDHFAYTFQDLGQLLATYKRLKAENILPVWTINHGPTTSFYYEDPDGNRVELQIDNFDSPQQALDYMSSAAFEANPVGVDLDADVLLSRYEQGDPIAELLQQGAA